METETKTKQLQGGKFNYGKWRLNKPKEPGFSHELMSSWYPAIKGTTDEDTLEDLPFPGVDTLLKAF